MTVPLSFIDSRIQQPVSIQSIGIVSAFGVGFDPFVCGLKAANTDPASVELIEDFPGRANRRVLYDAKTHLGRKGLTVLDRMSIISLLACQEALQGINGEKHRMGIVLGTSGGSMESIANFVQSTYEASEPHKVSPIKFPNTVMNCATAQCAIRFGLKGVNSTVCGGDLSGFLALSYAVRALRLGHADALIAGAVEECCKFTAWSHQRLTSVDSVMGEGAAFLALGGEREGALGEILDIKYCRTSHGPHGDSRRVKTINRALVNSGIPPSKIAWCSMSSDSPSSRVERRAIELSGCLNTQPIPPLCEQKLGNLHAARFSFQLAAALATAPEGLGLLTIAGPDEQFGCALIRVAPRSRIQGRKV